MEGLNEYDPNARHLEDWQKIGSGISHTGVPWGIPTLPCTKINPEKCITSSPAVAGDDVIKQNLNRIDSVIFEKYLSVYKGEIWSSC